MRWMNRFGLLAVAVVIVASVAPAQAFSTAELKGTFTFRITGYESVGASPGLVTVGTGIMRLNGKGSVTGIATFHKAGGGACAGEIRSSTYGVNPDGTGFMALGFFPSPCNNMALPLSLAVFRDGQGFEFASSGNDLFSGTARRRGAGPFDAASIAGSYAFRLTGFERVGADPGRVTVASGVMTFDGAGAVTGSATFRGEGGGACQGAIASSTYGVNADGTGFMALGFFPSPCNNMALPLSLAIVQGGQAIEFASSGNDLFSGTATRQTNP